ncbi:ABC transporter substrate-binding protein [Bradyrhizobium sp. Tv2a-2]|uniref:ABC transporter substrate-binding protein n=1 Tax=Bradyrhizobium sp. Tv2a-2 TaxID=113395 RepID=UPI001FDA1A04|nr:ABC transporter substrate-binding protein [Bradyrhizobium sp. Tv2a-2]
MTVDASHIIHARSSCQPAHWTTALITVLLATAANAGPDENTNAVRDLAGHVGPIIGSALSCHDIPQNRIDGVAEKFRAVIKQNSPNNADRDDLLRVFDRHVNDGRTSITSGKINCAAAERELADLEQSLSAPNSPSGAASTPSSVSAPASAAAAAVPTTTQPVTSTARSATDREIRFGIVAPFSGASRELGRQMKFGIDTAFNRINDAGGLEGRTLRLIAADDGNEPTRTLPAMKQLYEKDQVFAYVGNVGTATAAVAVPYALGHHALFFGAFSGAPNLRHDPPDRYVFNYRASYTEETDAAVRYLLKVRGLQPKEIAVFAQQDAFGDAGFAGVTRAFRSLGLNSTKILRLGYKRNTVDVDGAFNSLRAQKATIKAVVMVATYRAAAKFIEKSRALTPGMIYTNVSSVGASELADELMLQGQRFASGVIVTQVVPAIDGYSSAVLDYKNALAKYFPGEPPNYISFEGFVAANVLIEGIKRAGPQLDAEKLIEMLENTHNLDLGLGTPLNFGRSEHQASHKVWGTAIDDNGKYEPLELD